MTDARLSPNYPGQHGEPASGSREAGITARVDGHSQATGTRPQAQDSLRDQMTRVHRLAHQHGEWDAADWLARHFFESGRE